MIGSAPLLALALLGTPADEGAGPETYEEERLTEVLAAHAFELATPAPDDRITFIEIVRHEVFTEHDPFPDLLNHAHWLTVEEVVSRELLFEVGGPFDERIEETARILRRRFIFSLVRVVPVRRADGALGVLVFTRDLWSLRLEQAFQVTGLTVDRLLLQLTERNLLGRDKSLGVRFQMTPVTFSLGEVYFDRRVWGSAFRFRQSVDAVFNLATAAPEGGLLAMQLGVPFRTLGQPWGFELVLALDATVRRQLRGSSTLTWDDPLTPAREAYLRSWDRRAVLARAEATRQFGGGVVHRLTAGAAFEGLWVSAHPESGVPLAQHPSFAAHVLPVPRRQLYPFARYLAFTPDFRVFENLDSYGVSEVVRTGPAVSAEVRGGLRAAGSSSDFVLVRGAAGVTGAPWRGITDASVEASARLDDGEVIDRLLSVRLRAATPHVLAFRLTARLDVGLRGRDSNRTLVTLGGDNGLRGYPSQAFYAFGASRMRAGLELRSLPIEWRSVQGGVALFWDTGALFTDLGALATPRQSVGVGIRFLFPQFNKQPYLVNLGVPLDGSGFMVLLSLGDTQAVELAAPSSPMLDVRTSS